MPNSIQLHSLQVWADAEHRKGSDLTAEEKWGLGTDLIASLGDPVAAQRVHGEANNYYRLMRVLEVVLHTGRTLAEFDAKPDAASDYDFRCVHLGYALDGHAAASPYLASWSDRVQQLRQLLLQ